MAAKIIDGKAISLSCRNKIAQDTENFKKTYGYAPGLSVIIVGEDPASKVYVRNKKLGCEQVGFNSSVYELPENTTREELNALIDKLNADD
ncbi:MAG: bifunctional methylenetetrahydrofolate dehydrogenase/methenyltetrahydrofolate cyclohydrolase, partial [Clostridia bacterium]|nr:bifunctional methylenetetrahydrofolate dehydrogenase/methenyltetrahydrofolate cyclohydrolase [Clostridia bacterium]